MITRNVTEFRCDQCGKTETTTAWVEHYRPKLPEGMIALVRDVEIRVGDSWAKINDEDTLFCCADCLTDYLKTAIGAAVTKIREGRTDPDETTEEKEVA